MSNGAKVALAVGAGYLLGRTHKTRIALMLAAAGLTGKFPTKPSDLVAQGLKSLGTSEQVTGLADQLRGELLNAAKTAALTAATNRVDALNDRLQGRDVTETAERVSEPLRSVAGGGRSGPSDDEDVYDEDDEDLYGDEGEEGEEGEEEEPSDTEDEYEDAEVVDIDEETESDEEPDEEPEERPSPRARRRASRQQTAPRSSARRASRTASDRETSAGPSRRRRASAATKRAPVRRGR